MTKLNKLQMAKAKLELKIARIDKEMAHQDAARVYAKRVEAIQRTVTMIRSANGLDKESDVFACKPSDELDGYMGHSVEERQSLKDKTSHKAKLDSRKAWCKSCSPNGFKEETDVFAYALDATPAKAKGRGCLFESCQGKYDETLSALTTTIAKIRESSPK